MLAIDRQGTLFEPKNFAPIAGWVVLLFVLTLVGALPLLLLGLNLSQISRSGRFLPLVMTGMLVTACSPTLSALLVAGYYEKVEGVRSITRQIRIWRVSILWYAIALIGPIILFLAAEALQSFWHRTSLTYWMTMPSFSGPGGLPFVIFGSLLAEEPGWRGFGQCRLQKSLGKWRTAIAIGLLWSTWHLWYVILPGGLSTLTTTDVLAAYIRLTSTAVVYAWMYNSTQGSLLIAMLAHLGHNLAANLMPTQDGDRHHLVIALLYLVAATMIVLLSDRLRTVSKLRFTRSDSHKVNHPAL